MHPRLLDLVLEHRSTLIFVNARRLAERLATRLNELHADRLTGPAVDRELQLGRVRLRSQPWQRGERDRMAKPTAEQEPVSSMAERAAAEADPMATSTQPTMRCAAPARSGESSVRRPEADHGHS